MSIYYADTSAIAKRYLPEIGSVWVQGWVEPKSGNTIIISELTVVEFHSLLARRQREASISVRDLSQLSNDFLLHVRNDYQTISLTQAVITQARHLLIKYPLRSLDAIQLSCCHLVRQTLRVAPIFASADKKLLSVASLEGFNTEDPNNHP